MTVTLVGCSGVWFAHNYSGRRNCGPGPCGVTCWSDFQADARFGMGVSVIGVLYAGVGFVAYFVARVVLGEAVILLKRQPEKCISRDRLDEVSAP